MPNLSDPNFKDAVIYICEHGEDGAMGLIINHPTNVTMSRVFDEFELIYPENIGNQPLLLGGPVHQERGFVLHKASPQQWESTLFVSSEVCITASQDIITDIAREQGPECSYITLGYAGWAAGQLENELIHNSWLVSEADPQIIFEVPFDQRLTVIAQKMGIDITRLSPQAGRA